MQNVNELKGFRKEQEEKDHEHRNAGGDQNKTFDNRLTSL